MIKIIRKEPNKITIIKKTPPKITVVKKTTAKIDVIKKNLVNWLQEVEPIHESRGLLIKKRKEIKNIVEKPLIEACEILRDKNIQTYESSANQKYGKNYAWITIEAESLSEENRKIAEKYCGWPINDLGIMIFNITMPISTKTTPNEISEYFLWIVNEFKKQPATRIPRFTLQERLARNEMRLGKKYPEAVKEEKERLERPGEREKECKRLWYYFDKETQTGYYSEEHYKKANEKE